jgi:hypothetical protein
MKLDIIAMVGGWGVGAVVVTFWTRRAIKRREPPCAPPGRLNE